MEVKSREKIKMRNEASKLELFVTPMYYVVNCYLYMTRYAFAITQTQYYQE